MADEIRLNLNVTVRKPAASFDKQALKVNKTFDQTGVGGPSPGRISLTTSDTVISLAGLTTPGLCVMTNHDPTNSIEYGPTASGAINPLGLLLPGMANVIYLKSGITLRARAIGGTCVCSFEAYEA